MNWFETFRTGLGAVRTHRLRSVLTVLGIMIGIAAVVLTVGLGEGAQAKVTSEIDDLGTNLLTITPGSTTSSGLRGGLGTASTLEESDAAALASSTVAPDIRRVAPVISADESMIAGSNTWTASVIGTTSAWEEVRNRSVTEGRFIDGDDVADHTAVAVLGTTVVTELFKDEDPIGQTVEIGKIPVEVIGVLNAVGSSSSTSTAESQDDEVIMPISTVSERLTGSVSLSSILIEARSQAALSSAYQEADDELLALHHISDPTDADFTITSQQSILGTATSVDRTLTILLAGIAGISLLVGGIGVMNIMLVSVTERIREIGLRKALGATPRLIRRQFLVEATVLGIAGGTFGALVGMLGAVFLPHAIGDPISLSPAAIAGALLVAVAIGLVFGVYPASRAARLTPIDALRTE